MGPGDDDDDGYDSDPTFVFRDEPADPSSGFMNRLQKWADEDKGEAQAARGLLQLALSDEAPEEVDESGRYQIGTILGSGGMGEVREAYDVHLRRSVAVKALKMAAPGRAVLGRFVREAQVTGQLEHPNVVPVYDLGVDDDGDVFFSMRKIEGRSLQELMAAGDLGSLVDRLDVFKKICDAVAFAHSRGVVHSDLKPANVMIGQFGEVLVLDWGIAKVTGTEEEVGPDIDTDDVNATRDGSIVGTPAYMSPEQARGERGRQDARSDVYCLGALLYALLTGIPPFPQESPLAKVVAVAAGTFIPPRKRDRSVPRDLEAIVLHAMALEPSDRYPSVRAMRADVQAFLEGEPVSVARYTAFDRFSKWAKRHRQALTAGVIVAVAGGSLSLATGVLGAVGHISTLTVARDRAMDAERETALRVADSLVSLARVDIDLGQIVRAEERLEEAREMYLELGVSPRRADVARAWLGHEHAPAVLSLEGALAPQLDRDGRRVLHHDGNGVIRLHELPSGHLLGRLDLGPDAVINPFLEGADAFAAAMIDGGLQLWDVRLGQQRFELADVPIESVVRSRPGELWVTNRRDGVTMFDIATGAQLHRIPSLQDVTDLSEDGQRLLGVQRPGTRGRQPDAWYVWDRAGEVLRTLPGGSRGMLSPSGDAIALVSDGMQVFTDDGGFSLPDASVAGFRFASDDLFLLHRRRGDLEWYAMPDGELLASAQVPGVLRSASRSGDVVATSLGNRVEIRWRPRTSARTRQVDEASIVRGVATADDELLLTVGWSGRLQVLDARTGTMLERHELEASGVRGVDVSPDGRLAVTADRAGTVRLHDLVHDTSRELPALSEDGGLAVSAQFVGEAVVAAYEKGWLAEWSLPDGERVRHYPVPVHPWEVQATPDGGQLFVAGRGQYDPYWVLVDRSTGTEVRRSAEIGPAYEVQLTADGKHAAVGTHNDVRWVALATGSEEVWDTNDTTVGVAVSQDADLVAAATLAGELWLRDQAGTDLGTFRLVEGERSLVSVTFVGSEVVGFDGQGGMIRFDPTAEVPRIEVGGDGPTLAPGPLDRAIGRTLARAGDAEGAATHLERAVEQGADVPALERAGQLRAAGRFIEARALLDATADDDILPGTRAVWERALAE